MSTQNQWDTLSKQFDTHGVTGEIDSTVADNVLITWSPVIKEINKKFPDNPAKTSFGILNPCLRT